MGTELMEDGCSIKINRQFTDIGCPTIKNPTSKKGCWCIEEIKKQKKSHSNKAQKIQIHSNAIKAATANPIKHTNLVTNAQQQNIMEYIRNWSVANSFNHRLPINTNIANAVNTKNTSSVNMMQKNLIYSAQSQQYVPSNRMQQIRMQQMLLNARTNNNASAAKPKGSVLGQRQHKDTIVFTDDANKNGEPQTKRRKKSRWSSK